MITRVRVVCDDVRNNDYKEGETGYVDGYVRGGDDSPLAAVVIHDRIVLIPLYSLRVLRFTEENYEGIL